jgi:hypothetical protein
MWGTLLQLGPVWDSGWGKHNAKGGVPDDRGACRPLVDDTGKGSPAFGVLGLDEKECLKGELSRQNLALLDLGWFR